MSSKPMSQWDEHDLFGEGYLTTKPTFYGAHQVVESASAPETAKEEAGSMENRLPRPMSVHTEAPPLWRCNARKKHCPDGVECRELIDKAPTIAPCLCAACLLEMYPYLNEGPPFVGDEKMRELLEADYVGLYEPEGYTELRPLCAVCNMVIKIDGKTAAKFQRNEEDIIHVACLSDADAQALHELVGGYALPYIIRKRRSEKQEECDGRETEGEDSGPAG